MSITVNKKELSGEEYYSMLNVRENRNGKLVIENNLPEGKVLVMTSSGRYYIGELGEVNLDLPKKKKGSK